MTSVSNGNDRGARSARNDRRIGTAKIHTRFRCQRMYHHAPHRVFASMALNILILLAILLLPPHHRLHSTHRILFADAFASNLVETGIGCMTELATDEVIMNEEVMPPDQSDFPRMHLSILDGSEKPIEQTSFKYDPTIKVLKIAFVNPYTTSEFNDDLQFVLEIEGPTEDSRAAEFVSGGSIGCDNNKRVSERLMYSQAVVEMQINDPTAKLRIWGGWATGHNAVRLVPDLLLEPGEAGSVAVEEKKSDASPPETKEEVLEDIEDLEEEILEEEFQNTEKEKFQRELQEEKLEKLLNGDADETVAEVKEEDSSPETKEEVLQDIEDLEEEILEEEFQNTEKEKLQREQQEEKLEKLLDGIEPKEQEQRTLPKETKETTDKKPKLQRKRKNVLATDSVPEGLIDPNKQKKDLGLEIVVRRDRERGQQGNINESDGAKTIQDIIKDKQLDLDANRKNNNEQQKKRHKLTDHTTEHRQGRDIPETMELNDDITVDDLSATVIEPKTMNDDFLPPEESDDGEAEDQGDNIPANMRGSAGHHVDHGSLELQLVLEPSQHYLACAFFAASIGLFFAIFGKKRNKGRRDL